VTDLIAVLGEVKSKDTYLAAVLTLGALGAEARPAIPAILKNGERLGIFQGAFATDDGKTADGKVVLQILVGIAQGKAGVPEHTRVPAPAPVCTTGGTAWEQPAYNPPPAIRGGVPAMTPPPPPEPLKPQATAAPPPPTR
jgi:hypothetical protein